MIEVNSLCMFYFKSVIDCWCLLCHCIMWCRCSKPALNLSDPSNYHPISNLSFIYKLVEHAVHRQLSNYIKSNSLLPLVQSGFRYSYIQTWCASMCLKLNASSSNSTRSIHFIGTNDDKPQHFTQVIYIETVIK